jgi:arylsulfatase A-like enzyme
VSRSPTAILSLCMACGEETSDFLPREGVPDVVVVSMDGVRLDRTHFGGNSNPTTPSLDSIMDESLWFPMAWSQSNESLLSHSSLFTGRYVSEIALPDYQSFVLPDSFEPDIQVNTLAELMRLAGYQSAAFIGGGHIKAEYGIAQGFDPFVESADFGSFQQSLPPALDWMAVQPAETPLFMFLHGYDAHRPYGHASVFHLPFDADYSGPMSDLVVERNETEVIYRGVYYPEAERVFIRHATGGQMSDPVESYALLEQMDSSQSHLVLDQADLDHMAARYDSGVLAADTYVGMLIDALKSSGRWEQTLLIIVSDHGEDLQTHGYSNHRAVLFDSTTRVPFILSGGALPAEWRGQQSPALASSIDLLPTVAQVAQIETPVGTRGRSLWPLGTEIEPRAHVFQQGVTGQSSVRSATATHRLVFQPSGAKLSDADYLARMRSDLLLGGSFSLYHSAEEVWERKDIIGIEPGLAADLREAMLAWASTLERGEAVHTPSAEEMQSMQDAGYWGAPSE